MGILNSNAYVSIAKEANQLADTVVFENVLKMWSRLWARSRGNSVWYIHQDVLPQLAQMAMVVGVGGVPVYMPASGIRGMSAIRRLLFGIGRRCRPVGCSGRLAAGPARPYQALRTLPAKQSVEAWVSQCAIPACGA